MTNDFATKQQFHEQFYQQTSSELLEHINSFIEKMDELSEKTQGIEVREHPQLHNNFVRRTFVARRNPIIVCPDQFMFSFRQPLIEIYPNYYTVLSA
jgi:hypothetical protein